MEREFFLRTRRMGFSIWHREDLPLAELLWGDPAVTRLICASGRFSPEDVAARLELEVSNGENHGIQYWPLFDLETGEFMGCCGLRPRSPGVYELGCHLRPPYWGQGRAGEAAAAVLDHAFHTLGAEKIFVGHHPDNGVSRNLVEKLGFRSLGTEFYPPTGLYHPSYELARP